MEHKFLSLDWFKNRVENSIDRVIANKIDSLIEEPSPTQDKIYEKPYIGIKLVNDTLTVVLTDGSVLSKPSATEEDYYAILHARDGYEILAVMASHQVVADQKAIEDEANRMKALQQGIQLLAKLDDFTVDGQSVYLKGTSRSLPQLLVEKFLEVVDRVGDEPMDQRSFSECLNEDDDYVALKNFFMWC